MSRFALVVGLLAAVLAQAQTQTLASAGLKIDTMPMSGAGVAPLSTPTDMRFLPDGRMIIIEKGGYNQNADQDVNARVLIRANDGTLKLAGTFPVNIYSEQGLLGVEVDPDFATNRTLYFYYSRANGAGGTATNRHRIVSIGLKNDDTLDTATESILVQNLRGPANHNGGALAIGPDRRLYIGVGDTGCNATCCPANNNFASCLSNGNGKILRVELDGGIPSDNPLFGVASATACGAGCTSSISASVKAAPRTEIWAWGLRNAFRMSFDPKTGFLWAGDVGESAREEIDIIKGGKHYGYPWQEGVARCNQGSTNSSGSVCSPDAGICDVYTPGSGNCMPPVWDCAHQNNVCTSITGGTFVDSCSWPATSRGNYFFGDNAAGSFWSMQVNAARDGVAAGANPVIRLLTAGAGNPFKVPTSFKVGPDGNLYVVDYQDNRVARVSPVTPLSCDAGMGGGAGGGGGSGGGSGSTGGGSGTSGGGSGTSGGGSGASGGGSGASGGGASSSGGGASSSGGGASSSGGGASSSGGGGSSSGG
ncbi:MAG: PQQ-dependent sugar dehydrogenase, partial [Myxococcaceae bacterium]|nr:PQQ-dependent sugar dehydrogenase [Myxococcaceae bacterium]